MLGFCKDLQLAAKSDNTNENPFPFFEFHATCKTDCTVKRKAKLNSIQCPNIMVISQGTKFTGKIS